MFSGVFRFTKNIKFLLKDRICCTFRVFLGHAYCMRGPSLVKLTGNNNSATSTVPVIRMSPKEYVWSSHICSRVWVNRVRLSILLVVS